jgi:hypothetical protein
MRPTVSGGTVLAGFRIERLVGVGGWHGQVRLTGTIILNS